jgi:cytochrome c
VIGSRPGDVEGFNFSNAMQAVTEPWTYERLDAYLADPKGFIPGNKMAFAGVKKPEQRADILAYLRQMHPEPPPFPQ